MKLFALLFAFLLPLQAFALNGSGNVSNVLGLGAIGPSSSAVSAPTSYIPIPAGKTIFTLHTGGAQTALTSTNYYPFYKNGVLFQAGSSGTYCFNITLLAGTANTGGQLMSATATFALNASSVTGAVYQTGASARTALFSTNAAVRVAQPGVYTFGANTWGGFQSENSQNMEVSLDCYDI